MAAAAVNAATVDAIDALAVDEATVDVAPVTMRWCLRIAPTFTTNKTLIVKKVCRLAPDPFVFIYHILILTCRFCTSSPADRE